MPAAAADALQEAREGDGGKGGKGGRGVLLCTREEAEAAPPAPARVRTLARLVAGSWRRPWMQANLSFQGLNSSRACTALHMGGVEAEDVEAGKLARAKLPAAPRLPEALFGRAGARAGDAARQPGNTRAGAHSPPFPPKIRRRPEAAQALLAAAKLGKPLSSDSDAKHTCRSRFFLRLQLQQARRGREAPVGRRPDQKLPETARAVSIRLGSRGQSGRVAEAGAQSQGGLIGCRPSEKKREASGPPWRRPGPRSRPKATQHRHRDGEPFSAFLVRLCQRPEAGEHLLASRLFSSAEAPKDAAERPSAVSVRGFF